MERALLYLEVPAGRAIAVICNEVDAMAANDAGISRYWHLDVPDDREMWCSGERIASGKGKDPVLTLSETDTALRGLLQGFMRH